MSTRQLSLDTGHRPVSVHGWSEFWQVWTREAQAGGRSRSLQLGQRAACFLLWAGVLTARGSGLWGDVTGCCPSTAETLAPHLLSRVLPHSRTGFPDTARSAAVPVAGGLGRLSFPPLMASHYSSPLLSLSSPSPVSAWPLSCDAAFTWVLCMCADPREKEPLCLLRLSPSRR